MIVPADSPFGLKILDYIDSRIKVIDHANQETVEGFKKLHKESECVNQTAECEMEFVNSAMESYEQRFIMFIQQRESKLN